MNNTMKYLKIEKKIFSSLGRLGYIIIFLSTLLFIMFVIDFLLHSFVDNYFTSKFLFTGEISFKDWLHLMKISYSLPIFKLVLFGIIFLLLGIFRTNKLKTLFT